MNVSFPFVIKIIFCFSCVLVVASQRVAPASSLEEGITIVQDSFCSDLIILVFLFSLNCYFVISP